MKKFTAILAAAMMALSLTACGGSNPPASSESVPADLNLGQIITESRPAEENEYFPILETTEGDEAAMILEMAGLTAEDMDKFAISISPMMTHAYGIAVIQPAEGRGEAVQTALENFVKGKQDECMSYLQDQYEIAKAGKVETLENGIVVMTMCENAEAVHTAITEALTRA